MPIEPARLELLSALARKVLWLSSWTIHHANHIRPNVDGLKVGGHQASSASLANIMSALYFSVLRPQDRVAVKPHASPVFHAIQYLFDHQTREKLENFRGYKGAQSYPSRTKDADDVDFSTGSVGLGVAQTLFSSLVQDCQHKPEDHRLAEARLQLGLDLGVAGLGDAHRRRQLDRAGQLAEPRRGGAERDALGQVGADRGNSLAVQPVDGAGPLGDADVRDRAERHAGPEAVVTRSAAMRSMSCRTSSRRLHPDGDQPVVDRDLGERRVDVADGGDAHRLCDLARSDAKPRGLLQPGHDLDLGTRHRALGRDAREQRIAAAAPLRAARPPRQRRPRPTTGCENRCPARRGRSA